MALFTEPRARLFNGDTRSLVDLIRELRDEFVVLIRQQAALVQAEAETKVRTVARNAVYLVIGGVAAILAGVLLLVAVVAGLYAGLVAAGTSPYVAGWLSPLIIALLTGAAAAALISKGLLKLKNMGETAPRTKQTLQEHQEWISHKMR